MNSNDPQTRALDMPGLPIAIFREATTLPQFTADSPAPSRSVAGSWASMIAVQCVSGTAAFLITILFITGTATP